jgi:hypothetical protein
MGDNCNGLLEKLDKAWVEHVEQRADVRALVRIMKDGKPLYVLFGDSKYHDEMHGRCREITDAYRGQISFGVQLLNQAVYEETRERLQPKIDQGLAKVLYEG